MQLDGGNLLMHPTAVCSPLTFSVLAGLSLSLQEPTCPDADWTKVVDNNLISI